MSQTKHAKPKPQPIIHCRQMRIDDKGTTTSGDDTSIEDIKVKKAECFCNRNFTVDEIKCIIQQLRGSKTVEPLFDAKNCQLPEADKTYEKFTEEFNKICTKYEINTCLRKIHFLAQIAVEAALFHTTVEAVNNICVNYKGGCDFRGRGLKQLTHDYNYLEYYDYKNGTNYNKDFKKILNTGEMQKTYKNGVPLIVTIDKNTKDNLTNEFYQELKKFAESIGKSLELSWDTAGWFWMKMKLEESADKDDCTGMTYKINGGYNNLKERTENTKKLKEVFEYATCKNHK
ncbi:hypothetical protein [Sulfuricurvum sp.]|uniref:hypothetical protein n=1 Tax=Sulfuricurvum sp. TaxID=2025608 RepID=UPI0026303259|nr:hypothetical protein [Sulfuricurvum sp.]MDD3597504.1 hypothetical protein [Sulfuricurvum sp.]